jgi:hypothetical protein
MVCAVRMNRFVLRVGVRRLAGAALALSLAGCTFEEVRCEISFETDAMPGVSNAWVTQECSAESFGNVTSVDIDHDGQSIAFDMSGPLTAGEHEIEIQYWDGSRNWAHDGRFNGVGPVCVVVLDSARKESWTKTDRVRMSGTIECPGTLTSINPETFEDDDELVFSNASFDVFGSSELRL